MTQLRVRSKEALRDCAEPFDNTNNYRKIIRFADDALRQELTGYIDHINTRNENARLEKLYQQAMDQRGQANSEEAFKAVSGLFAAISGYKDSAVLAERCLEQAEGSRLDVLYAAAKKLMTGEEPAGYQKAIRQFEALGDWRDSRAQIEVCSQKIKEIEQRKENQRLEVLYQKALSALQNANSEESCKAASRLFADIGDFKDSAAMAEKCLEKAEGCRLDSLYIAAKNMMTGSKTVNYREAINRFEALGGWKDSEQQIEICQRKIMQLEEQAVRKAQREQQRAETAKAAGKNAQYLAAKKLMTGKKPNYEEAIRRFEELGDWKDSAEQIDICRQKIAQAGEVKPQRVIRNKKKLAAVAAAVCAAAVFAVVLTTVVIPNSNYKKAVALMDAGNVVEAYDALIALGDYKDSAQKAASIYNAYKLQTAQVGDYVVFGTYEQDNDLTNGAEEIEWLVLDKQDDKLLIISKFGLDCQRYNTAPAAVTWKTCTLRRWLNDDFLKQAFTAEEQASILTVTVEAHNNNKFSADPGKAVQDKVFLLSIVEADLYFSSDSARLCEPTAYAVAQGASGNSNGRCQWWLRSPGYNQSYAAFVSGKGRIDRRGYEVFHYKAAAVRPALWITINDPAALEDAYNEAVRLMDEGSYDEAITAFEALGGYQDSRYLSAVMLMGKGSYEEAIAAFELQADYKDSADRILECRYQLAGTLAEEGSFAEAVEIYNALGIYKDSADKAIECARKYYDAELENLTSRREITKAAIFYYKQGQREKSLEIWDTVATSGTLDTGVYHTVALKNDGTVVAVGNNRDPWFNYISNGQCNVTGWKNIIAISAGDYHTVGLRDDHTVVATGLNTDGQCDVSDWTDIVAIAAGDNFTAGLKADGTVVTAGKHSAPQWTNVMAISAKSDALIGLKTDGTTLGIANTCTDIVAIAACGRNKNHLCLCADGTLFMDGRKVESNIASIYGGARACVAITRNGDMLLIDGDLMSDITTPELAKWDVFKRKDVVAFSSNARHAVVLLADGTVRSYGDAGWSRLNVGGWTDIKMPQP